MSHEFYENPLGRRYASQAMRRLFSDDTKFRTWRRLWIALAETERELGLPIPAEALEEMRRHVEDIDYEAVRVREEAVRHDVMAHIQAYAEQCPAAHGVIHLGATSAYVGDNADLLILRAGLDLLRGRVLSTIAALASFAERYAGLPTLAYTHFQPAQPTTVGKRATLWLQDLTLDLDRLDFTRARLPLLGCKGATGTAASFLELFEGDHDQVKRLEAGIAARMGVDEILPVSGQTYPRKLDDFVLSVLSGLAQSAAKFSNDIRLLSHLREAEEPFEVGQIGSSAMAYKRNPMRSERIASLARFVITAAQNTALTAAAQWFERTLDDSANRRLVLSETFLATEAILLLYANIAGGLVVNPAVIARHLHAETPFLATEAILMRAVKAGGDRQVLHEIIRRHSLAAAARLKEGAEDNDLIDRLVGDGCFPLSREELEAALAPEGLVGRAAQQTHEYLAYHIQPLLAANPPPSVGADGAIRV
ncbi:MAG: adenylosuccinate lyase [Planctomycetes bacterium]|nr:adenylosuccinate lyase [Planctomycetota bacterium]